jgi:hypothetical protein
MDTSEFNDQIDYLIDDEVKRRIDFALVGELEGGAYEMYKRMKEVFGDKVGELLAELYAHAVKDGLAKPILAGVRIDAKSSEHFEFASIDLSEALKKLGRRTNIVLELHNPKLSAIHA